MRGHPIHNFLLIICVVILMLTSCSTKRITTITTYSDDPVSITPVVFEAVEIGSSSYSHPTEYAQEYKYAVQWISVLGQDHLPDLSEEYSFQPPNGMNFDEHAYIVSFGCKILEFWSEEMNGNDYVLSVTYAEDYQGEQAFIYELPHVRIYPLQYPSYVLKEGERVFLGTHPNNYDLTLFKGYEG